MFLPLVGVIGVRQQRQLACTLNSRCQLALIFGGNARDTARHHFAALGYVTFQHFEVFVIDLRCIIDRKWASLATAHHATTATWATWAITTAFFTITALSAFGTIKAHAASPSFSLRRIADGPSGSCSIRTVRKRRTSSLKRRPRSSSSLATAGPSTWNSV